MVKAGGSFGGSAARTGRPRLIRAGPSVSIAVALRRFIPLVIVASSLLCFQCARTSAMRVHLPSGCLHAHLQDHALLGFGDEQGFPVRPAEGDVGGSNAGG